MSSRLQLKSYFVKYATPTESNFSELIDSFLSSTDDRVSRASGEPLRISADPKDPEQRVLEFASGSEGADATAEWVFGLRVGSGDEPSRPGLAFIPVGSDKQPLMFLDAENNRVGIGTTGPGSTLSVKGNISAEGFRLEENSRESHLDEDGALYRHAGAGLCLTVSGEFVVRRKGAGSQHVIKIGADGSLDVAGALSVLGTTRLAGLEVGGTTRLAGLEVDAIDVQSITGLPGRKPLLIESDYYLRFGYGGISDTMFSSTAVNIYCDKSYILMSADSLVIGFKGAGRFVFRRSGSMGAVFDGQWRRFVSVTSPPIT